MIDEVEEKVEEAYIQKKEEGMNRFCLLQKKNNPIWHLKPPTIRMKASHNL